jgi:hypothetical protein
MTKLRRSLISSIATAIVFTAIPVLAGPPLVCFPFDVQGARTLPMGANGWHDTDAKYDVSRLVDDTVALLGPETPVIVRMETLRRATLYAATNRSIGATLLTKLEDRAKTATPQMAALADFDLGYLIETYRQAALAVRNSNLPSVEKLDGYPLVLKALALRPDPQIDFAAAVMSYSPKKADHQDHVRNALLAAKENQLIATNAASHGLTQ